MRKRLTTTVILCAMFFFSTKIVLRILEPRVIGVSGSKKSEDHLPGFHFGDGIAFKQDDPRSTMIPIPAELNVVAPKQSIFKPGEKLECEVSVTLPEGAVLPTFLSIGFLDSQGSIAGDALLKAKRRGQGGSYIGVGTINAPKKKGRYSLHATSQIIRRTEAGGNRDDVTDVGFDTASPKIMIEVR